MPELAFVMSPGQGPAVREFNETIAYELSLQGIQSTVHREFPEPRPGLVYAVTDPTQYVALEGAGALRNSVLKRTVFICTGPPPRRSHVRAQRKLLSAAGAVFAVDPYLVVALQQVGVSARPLRPGYSQLRDRFHLEAGRPIDAIVLDSPTARRDCLLAEYKSVLVRHKLTMTVVENPAPRDNRAPGDGDSESRFDLLAKAKLVIILHPDDRPYFDLPLAIDAIHCGAIVVAEHAAGLSHLVPGKHLLVGSADSLPFVIRHVLRDRELQQRLRVQAYERLTNWLPFALSVALLRATLVAQVGASISVAGREPPAEAQPSSDARSLLPSP